MNSKKAGGGLGTRLKAGGGLGTRLKAGGGLGTRLKAGGGLGTRLKAGGGLGTRLKAGGGLGTRLKDGGGLGTRLKDDCNHNYIEHRLKDTARLASLKATITYDHPRANRAFTWCHNWHSQLKHKVFETIDLVSMINIKRAIVTQLDFFP